MIFHEISAEDGRWARELLAQTKSRSCEYTFVNIYMWSRVYRSKIARYKDFVVARSEGSRLHYLYPAGRGSVAEAVDAILKDAADDGRAPVLFSLTEADKAALEAQYPGQFRYEKPRKEADYLYLCGDLADLPGKKFQKKRNHCARFERMYDGRWEFAGITPDKVKEIAEFNNRWCQLYDNRGDAGIEEEHRAVSLALRHYDELGLSGGYLTVDGQIVAFSFGSPLDGETFVTHVEKALYDISGAYNIINREMARAFCRGYTYINRENDVDEPGLRTAKLSYQPVALEEKYTAEWISG